MLLFFNKEDFLFCFSVVTALAAFLLGLLPLAAVILLGSPGAMALLAAPDWVAALYRSLLLAGLCVPVALCVGFAGALGLWGAPRWVRFAGVGAVLLSLVMPGGWTGDGLLVFADRVGVRGAHIAALAAAHAVPAAGLVFVVFSGAFNRIDPRVLETAAGCGAGGWRAWRIAVLPNLGWPTCLAGCVAFSGGLGASVADPWLAAAYHPTLGTLLSVAAATADARAAPGGLVLAALMLAPLGVLAAVSWMRGLRK